MSKYDWNKIELDFLKSNMTGVEYCKKNNIPENTFYINIKVAKTKGIIKKKHKKKLNKKLEKIAEKRAENSAELWANRAIENKEENFEILELQRTLLKDATSELKNIRKQKNFDLRSLETAVKILEKIVDIGEKLMDEEKGKPDMPTTPYADEIIIDAPVNNEDIPEYKQALKNSGLDKGNNENN